MKNKILLFKNLGRNLILALIFGMLSIGTANGQECLFEQLSTAVPNNFGRSICYNSTDKNYVIPVAIHVINHGGTAGSSFPTDNSIMGVIDAANAILSPKFTLVAISNPANCNSISFRPAQVFKTIDPIGNKSEEITIKNLSRIDPNTVCNIWFVQNVVGGNGFAYLPFDPINNPSVDGIVLSKLAFGTVNSVGKILAHEIGHYLGLYHPWGENEFIDENCHLSSQGCTHGDFIEDTEPCRGPLNSGFTTNTCEVNDNIWNWYIARRNVIGFPFCAGQETYPCRNIMNVNEPRQEFTHGQIEAMDHYLNLYRSSLGAYNNECLTCTDPCEPCYYGTPPIDPSTNNPHNDFCSPCHAGHEHLDVSNITGIVNITQPTLITENLTISGGTLNVNSELYVAPGKIIYVQNQGILNVGLNGHITSCSTEVWKGVNPSNGTVKVNDGGKISKAFNGITAIGNNTITCRNAEFFDIQQAGVLILGNSVASFNNTSFWGMEDGVAILGASNITSFINCTFAYQSDAGIITYGSSVNVTNNTQFIGCTQGISLNNTFGTSSFNSIGNSETSANQFINCYNGIYSVNTTTDIRNNYFQNNNYGLVFPGLNKFQSHNNTFAGSSYAEAIDGTGENINQSFSNNYSSDVGIYPHNYNRGYNFYNNCFNTLWWDVNAFGVINQNQFGPGDRAAGNCFTKGGVDDFMYTGVPVFYGIPDDPTAADCLYPDNTGGWDYTTLLSEYVGSGECGAQFVSENQYGYLIRMGCNELRLKKSTDSLKLIVKSLKDIKDRPLTKIEKVLLAKTERHLRFAIAQWAWCLRKEGRRRELKEWFKEWSKFFPDDKYFAIGAAEVTAELGEYIQSKAELDSISLVHNLHPDILQSLKISIDVLQANESRSMSINSENDLPSELLTNQSRIDGRLISGFQLTIPNHELLRRVANMVAPEAAYGRALLSYLTGEVINPPSTMPVFNRSKPIGQIAVKSEEIYKMNPNPALQDVTIEIQNEEEGSQYNYILTNLTGIIAAQGIINGVTNINISNISNGIYIVRITKDNMPVDIKKLIIQK